MITSSFFNSILCTVWSDRNKEDTFPLPMYMSSSRSLSKKGTSQKTKQKIDFYLLNQLQLLRRLLHIFIIAFSILFFVIVDILNGHGKVSRLVAMHLKSTSRTECFSAVVAGYFRDINVEEPLRVSSWFKLLGKESDFNNLHLWSTLTVSIWWKFCNFWSNSF